MVDKKKILGFAICMALMLAAPVFAVYISGLLPDGRMIATPYPPTYVDLIMGPALRNDDSIILLPKVNLANG